MEDYIEMSLDDFNKGPTNGTLNDKRRMAWIYEELLKIRTLLESQGIHEDTSPPKAAQKKTK